jgi:hypothetical protein
MSSNKKLNLFINVQTDKSLKYLEEKGKKEFYYKQNCASDRQSIQNFSNTVKHYLSKTCDILPIEKIENIVGPVSYNEYIVNDKTIGIFGEFHFITDFDMDILNGIPKKKTVPF